MSPTDTLLSIPVISADRLMHHVRMLAAPNMRGRMPGDHGYELASRHVESAFARLGLKPLGDNNSFRQHFPLETNRITRAEVRYHTPDGRIRPLNLGVDFICRGLTDGARIRAPLTFVGYGRQDGPGDELAVDLTGRIALDFKHPAPFASDKPQELPRARGRRYREKGAIGLAVLHNPNHPDPDRLSASLMEDALPLPGFPMIVLSSAFGMSLLSNPADSLAARQYRINSLGEVASGPVAGELEIDIEAAPDRNGRCWNVIGVLEGSDPERANEAIVIGAHLDHVGIQGESVIFHGAQDDASGVSALLEIAAELSRRPHPRTMIFIAFGAEETGIVGSLYYGEHPSWPLDRTIGMYNLDCMGAGIGLDTRGRKHHPDFFTTWDDLNARFFRIPDTCADHVAGGADAEAFQRAGITNMFIVAKQPYQHLHMASDTPETLNPVLFEAITRLTCMTVETQAHAVKRSHP